MLWKGQWLNLMLGADSLELYIQKGLNATSRPVLLTLLAESNIHSIVFLYKKPVNIIFYHSLSAKQTILVLVEN
jgi:hypothetical protein